MFKHYFLEQSAWEFLFSSVNSSSVFHSPSDPGHTSDLMSLSLLFPVSKMGVLAAPTSQGRGKSKGHVRHLRQGLVDRRNPRYSHTQWFFTPLSNPNLTLYPPECYLAEQYPDPGCSKHRSLLSAKTPPSCGLTLSCSCLVLAWAARAPSLPWMSC